MFLPAEASPVSKEFAPMKLSNQPNEFLSAREKLKKRTERKEPAPAPPATTTTQVQPQLQAQSMRSVSTPIAPPSAPQAMPPSPPTQTLPLPELPIARKMSSEHLAAPQVEFRPRSAPADTSKPDSIMNRPRPMTRRFYLDRPDLESLCGQKGIDRLRAKIPQKVISSQIRAWD